MSTFLLSCFLCTLQFGDKLLVVAAHGAFDGFVIQQAFQCFLPGAVVGVAKYLCKLLGGEFVWQLAETLNELVGASALLSSINQLVVVILSAFRSQPSTFYISPVPVAPDILDVTYNSPFITLYHQSH